MRKRGERVLGPYRHGRGWQLVLVAADGTRGVESFASQERAAARRRELDAARVVAATTIDEAIDAYERHLTAKGNKPRSYRETVRRLRRFWPELALPLEDITPQRARAAYAAIAATMAVDSHRNMLAEAKTFLRWCVGQGWLRRSPLEEVQGQGKRRHGKPQLGLDQAVLFTVAALEAADRGEDGGVAVLCALLLGMRASEIAGLTAGDVDDGGRRVWIRRSKTDAGVRGLVVPDMLAPLLRALARGKLPAAPLFRSQDRLWVRAWTRRLCERAGVPVVSPHGLRGTFATLAKDGGQATLAVAQALGHAGTGIVMGVYARPGSGDGAGGGQGHHAVARRQVMGVGFPAALLLHEFGSKVWDAFDAMPYHVGSSLTQKSGWRDVDVRLILDDVVYEAMGLGDPIRCMRIGKWIALCQAFSALGRDMTGLPIDFQIQQQTWANATFDGPRSAIGIVPWRMHTAGNGTGNGSKKGEGPSAPTPEPSGGATDGE